MKYLILVLIFIMTISINAIEISSSFSFRTPKDETVDVMDYEIALEIVTDNMYLEIERELENGQKYFNYEMKAEYNYIFKRKKYHPILIEQKELLEMFGEQQRDYYEITKKNYPPEIIETPFSVGLSTRTLEISSRDIKYSQVGLNLSYEFKASQINFFLFRYFSKGNYILSFKNRWIDNKTPEQILVLTKSLKYKLKPIFNIDYALSYSSPDFKQWEKEISFRISADVYFFAVYFKYSLKEFGQIDQSGKFGLSVNL